MKRGRVDDSNHAPNGKAANGKAIKASRHFPEKDKHNLVLNSFRCLIADIVQQFDGGHPG